MIGACLKVKYAFEGYLPPGGNKCCLESAAWKGSLNAGAGLEVSCWKKSKAAYRLIAL